MRFLIRANLRYAASQPCDLLLQIEALSDGAQRVHTAQMTLDRQSVPHSLVGEEGLGTRQWIEAGSNFECRYEAQVDVTRTAALLDTLAQTPRVEIPADVVKYLMPSRYCHPELFLDFVSAQFGDLCGGAMIRAMRDWIACNFTYDSDASPMGATATDSFKVLSGVCRDYTHVLITFARAAGIPARFVSVYAPDVKPQDFHAVAEVYLGGSWHLVDATGMARPEDIIRICVGRDATDASFVTSYGWLELVEQSVQVTRITL
ncbi:transglutaminase-like domain-containing protein [Celeribacter marinus]|uniref:Transglutaminase-like n=1 Tax=Celeribacter marinus TaxID=1397108 RepID=A0A0P0A710_9RHOB|nr:transglutaminase family protein [Celeribacter marinus]ALI54110.1 transglutaminase-like [Celeribacter marinus]SFL02444.1 Transglutaminase-like superfamily protein [Celeribacter marinus]